MQCFKPALNSKGLRRAVVGLALRLGGFKPALNSKGLRLFALHNQSSFVLLQASPEFKGIKTRSRLLSITFLRFKPALNSKGLRLKRAFV